MGLGDDLDVDMDQWLNKWANLSGGSWLVKWYPKEELCGEWGRNTSDSKDSSSSDWGKAADRGQ